MKIGYIPVLHGLKAQGKEMICITMQVTEAREWHTAMERAMSHWTDRALYAAFAQWHIFAQVRLSMLPDSTAAPGCS